jgi:hypothetical protein
MCVKQNEEIIFNYKTFASLILAISIILTIKSVVFRFNNFSIKLLSLK